MIKRRRSTRRRRRTSGDAVAVRSRDFLETKGKGASNDAAAGTRAKTAIMAILKNGDADESLKRIRGAYDKVCKATDGLSKTEIRAVCFGAASDFTWDSIVAKARRGKAGPRLGRRDRARIEAIRKQFGGDQADQFEKMLLFGKSATRGR